jgi:hypothetical protein
MPDQLDHERGYVLLVTNDEQVGTLYELDIVHGWRAAQLALQLVQWRKEKNYGDDMVREVRDRFAEQVDGAETEFELRAIWKDAWRSRALTDGLKQRILDRRETLSTDWTAENTYSDGTEPVNDENNEAEATAEATG